MQCRGLVLRTKKNKKNNEATMKWRESQAKAGGFFPLLFFILGEVCYTGSRSFGGSGS
jgi:hypothetical protein